MIPTAGHPTTSTPTSLLQRAASARGLLDIDEAHIARELDRNLQWLVAWDGSFDAPRPEPPIDPTIREAHDNVASILHRGVDPLDLDEALASFLREFAGAGSDDAARWAHECTVDVWWMWPHLARALAGNAAYLEALADDCSLSPQYLARLVDRLPV